MSPIGLRWSRSPSGSRNAWRTRASTSRMPNNALRSRSRHRHAALGGQRSEGSAAARGDRTARRPAGGGAAVERSRGALGRDALPGRALGRRRSRQRRRRGCPGGYARRARLGWLLTLASAPLAAVGLVANAVGILAVSLAGRRPAPPVRHATIKFLTAIAAFTVELGRAAMVGPRRRGSPLAAHPGVGSDLRSGGALGRGPGAPGAAGAAGPPPARRCRGRARGPPRPPRPPRGSRPRCHRTDRGGRLGTGWCW